MSGDARNEPDGFADTGVSAPDGFADTGVSEPDPAPPPDSDPLADTAADLGGSSGDALKHAALKASVRAKMFAGAGEAPRVGRYAILKVLGEGGMGTVYACFDDQLDRRVALKLVKGLESRDARQRMLREAQAMAKLSHPNVVPVFEVGEHDGQLFVAMEYVKGVTLAQWQTEDTRDWREVLGKYLQAGRGLAAAHAEGLVHRDFKPHNAVVGADGRVRVLDFGLAAKKGEKAITGSQSIVMPRAKDAALDTPLTETGTVMGTPAYMPPEQFTGGRVDARSDQFSFCVALWEGLHGVRPFEGNNTSELLARVAQGQFELPEHRGVPEPVRDVLRRGLQFAAEARWPDLDSVLAQLERLNVDPAHARRRRRFIGGATLGGIAVVAGAFVAPGQIEAYRTDRCEAEAAKSAEAIWNEDTRTRVRDGLRATGVGYAQTTADKALARLDAYAHGWQMARAEVCIDAAVRERLTESDLDRATWCLEAKSMAMSALVERLEHADSTVVSQAVPAAIDLTSTDTCLDAGLLRRLPAPPAAQAREAVATTQRRIMDANASRVTGHYDAGLEVARAALEQAEALDHAGLRAQALLALGRLQDRSTSYAQAEPTLEDAYFAAVALDDHETALLAAQRLVHVVGYQLAKHEAGFRWARHAQTSLDKLDLGPTDPRVAQGLNDLAGVHLATGERAKAEAKLQRALAIREEALGPDHPAVALTLNDLAVVQEALGEGAQAKAGYQRALAIWEHTLGSDHPDVSLTLGNLGTHELKAGHYAEATRLLQRTLAIREKALGADHLRVADTLHGLGQAQRLTGEYPQAKASFERAIAIKEKALGPADGSLAASLQALAACFEANEEYSEAIRLRSRVLAILEEALDPDDPELLASTSDLAAVHTAAGEYAPARALYERVLAVYEGSEGLPANQQASRWAVEFRVAKIILRTGGDRTQAIARAKAAADGLRSLGEDHAESLAVVEAWLVEVGDAP